MKVLVTGGAGFIGSHIVDKLVANKFQVAIIDNLSTGKKDNVNKKANFYCADIKSVEIKDIFRLEQPDIVFHLAAQIDVQTSVQNPLLDAEVNILGTLNLVKQSTNFGVSKIIYASSAAVYGNPKYLGIDENHPQNPISCYGISKYTAEKYLDIYARLTGLKYTVLRYANVYGPRQSASGEGGVVSIFADKLIQKQTPFIFGDGEQTRDFVYVKDIAEANLLALSTGDNQIFNISSNTQTSVNELLRLMNKTLKSDIKPDYLPPRVGDIMHSYLDNSKAMTQLNWRPLFELDRGIRETVEYYRNG